MEEQHTNSEQVQTNLRGHIIEVGEKSKETMRGRWGHPPWPDEVNGGREHSERHPGGWEAPRITGRQGTCGSCPQWPNWRTRQQAHRKGVKRKNWKVTSMDISRNLRRNCKKWMLTRNNCKPLHGQIKKMENKIRGKDSDRVIWEFKFLWKIRELCEKLEKTDTDNKEAESTISTPPGQRKYYEMKQQERDATSGKEHIAIYGFIDKLHKQLQKCQSRKRTWATIRRQCEELRTSLTETHFERETGRLDGFTKPTSIA